MWLKGIHHLPTCCSATDRPVRQSPRVLARDLGPYHRITVSFGPDRVNDPEAQQKFLWRSIIVRPEVCPV
ncbi:hypothetical protein HBI56_072950 [Parastagonospora nodorum]|uniref:Uncharacterized protein n=1 Tax=Phaeosphaeria nodorum (strain SN15 / ATCC MYA-4574 / FGSC 10173) TaxID=321614 RepID=A0A7U2EWX1_PHANO|nr:hypothetical protein HBH56_172040 [Parastagonospora nodorum]QRC94570.1 hypothetical protein JI435_406030 [Parastagonospora nodorum SN15]KAH3928364.1 hypothetical protein HBH54_140600 [Parastagonospora nodorum]KAH3945278.1 hypothetical protein HBH53_145920 [Parastagonospora nodorum]KAH4054420.1 hypothetical protein HBH49_080050 [Parastagonospora nodorum]